VAAGHDPGCHHPRGHEQRDAEDYPEDKPGPHAARAHHAAHDILPRLTSFLAPASLRDQRGRQGHKSQLEALNDADNDRLLSIRQAQRSASQARTSGYLRLEILAAALNALLLFAIGVFVIVEAAQRPIHPPEMTSGIMVAFGVMALAGNACSPTAVAPWPG